MGRRWRLVTALLTLCVAASARAGEPGGGVELCVQRPEGGLRTLGHVRLVVGEVFYERRTPDDEISGQPTEERLDEARNRRSRTFLHLMPPMLRFPLSRRLSWGVTVRDRVPDREKHPDGTEYWPFECFAIPTGEEQRDALRRRGDARVGNAVGSDRAVVFDHEFDYVRDNCTTSLCLLLAEGLRDASVDSEAERALLEILDRETRPVRLLRRLRAWTTAHGSPEAVE